ncbi:MAG: hypothetical protein O7C98_12980 [Planctomycetota bacterium]|nr:hypothetical protein [Planctomycetota bacterium]
MATRPPDAPDAVWHVTSRVNWQAWHLDTAEAYDLFLRLLGHALHTNSVDLLGCVVMSNHYHAVLRSPGVERFKELTGRPMRCRHFRPWPYGHPQATVIGQCVREFKLSVSRALQDEMGLTGHFWQGRHDRRRLWDEWALVVALAHDHRNPVRAGMAARPEDYPRSSARWWSTGEPFALPLACRPDFALGCEREAFRTRLLRFQRERRLDDVMKALFKSRRSIDSAAGRWYLEQLLLEAGLDPLSCGTGAALRRA